jgi:diguanylate cyclase (GGDEF)-like protein
LNASELFIGTYARLYAYTGILVLLAVILVMSVRLFASRRRKAYVSLTVAVAAFIAQYILLFGIALSGHSSPAADLAAQMMQAVAFILINRACFQLYNTTRTGRHFYFYFALLVTIPLAAFRLQAPSLFAGSPEQLELLGRLAPDLYLTVLVLVCFVALPHRIGQGRTYQFALIAYFVHHLAYLVNTYILDRPAAVLTVIELYVPLLYYFALFQLLFERIVELMQASYQSAITDGLTGLFNRRYLLKRAAQYVNYGHPVAVVFSDIDNFKKLNDTQGHQAGDEALRKVARILLEESEEIGMAGRFGGEEMVVLLTDSSVDPGALAEKVRSRVEAEAGVTVSVGYAKSRKGMTAEQVVAQADQAMYAAKMSGKNKVVRYTAGIGSVAK